MTTEPERYEIDGDDFTDMPVENRGPAFDPERLDDPDEISKLLESHEAVLSQLDTLHAEREKLLRHIADERNNVRIARQNLDEQRRQSVASVARDVITALDHFDMALSQDLASATPESLLAGMRVIRSELVRAITRHGVVELSPSPNDEFDPMRHEAIARQPISGVDSGRIACVVQSGFSLGDRVIRPAKVVVGAEQAEPRDAPPGAGPDAGSDGGERA